MKLCLVCSAGGHFHQMYSLREFWGRFDRFWVTFPSMDTQSLLQNENKYWAYEPTQKNLKNAARNLMLAIRVLRREQPDAVISTGAAVAVPFLYVARALKMKTVYIESITRVKRLSLSGRLVYPVVNHFLVQWPELSSALKKAAYEGSVL